MAEITKCSFVFGFTFIIILTLTQCQHLPGSPSSTMDNVIYLQPGLSLRIKNPSDLDIFCFIGHDLYLTRAWETVMVKVHLDHDAYDQFVGSSPEEVSEEYNLHHMSWKFSIFSSKDKALQIHPFNQTCVGIHVHNLAVYKIELIVIRIDYWRVLMGAAGLLLFISAQKLSSNPLFYYITGVTTGICASFLILIYLFSKLLPKKPMMYGAVIGGWTISVYFFKLLWSNFRLILEHYFPHVVTYVVSVGVLSFAFCYRFGPVTDPRSKNLIKWTLQGVGLLLIVFSSWFMELMITFCVILLALHNFPAIWITKFKLYWKRRFPPRVNLLNEDEYYEQGVRETHKALQELRGYCSSPECDAWRTVLKIKDPIRFAEFMSGKSHLNDEEMLAYESESRRRTPTDRSECDSDSEEDDYMY